MGRKTIRDVAKRANVSVATVSRVLNNNKTVHPELRSKVYETIRELNYVPNVLARGLKTEHTKTIGIIASDISNYYFIILAKTLERILRPLGYTILFSSNENNPETELACLNTYISMQVAGILINTTGYNDHYIAEVSHRIPVVLIDREVSHPYFNGDRVGVDDERIGYDITKYLLERGHRHVGLINGSTVVSTGRDRLAGYCRAMDEYHLKNYEPYTFCGEFTAEAGYDSIQRMMALSTPPTALAVMNQDMSSGVLKYLRNNNIRVPQDISLAMYGYIHDRELLYVTPSGIQVDPAVIAREGLALLQKRIENANSDKQNHVVVCSPPFLSGNSVRQI